jgi:hypothetical protein
MPRPLGGTPSNMLLASIVMVANGRLSLVAQRVSHYPSSAGRSSLANVYAPIGLHHPIGYPLPGSENASIQAVLVVNHERTN